jgi:hypothetical protein
MTKFSDVMKAHNFVSQAPEEQLRPTPQPDLQADQSQAAKAIIETYKQNSEIAEAVKQAFHQDIRKHENPFYMLTYMCEALDRMSGKGDKFYLWARNEIIQEYGLNACNRTSEVK